MHGDVHSTLDFGVPRGLIGRGRRWAEADRSPAGTMPGLLRLSLGDGQGIASVNGSVCAGTRLQYSMYHITNIQPGFQRILLPSRRRVRRRTCGDDVGDV